MSGTCCINPGAKQSHVLQGDVEEVAGLSTYKTGHGKSAIVLFAELFGYAFVNTRKVADTFADATGTTVFVPDLFNGDPMDPDDPDLMEHLPAWLNKHPIDEACSLSAKFISAIKGHYNTIQVSVNTFPMSVERILCSNAGRLSASAMVLNLSFI